MYIHVHVFYTCFHVLMYVWACLSVHFVFMFLRMLEAWHTQCLSVRVHVIFMFLCKLGHWAEHVYIMFTLIFMFLCYAWRKCIYLWWMIKLCHLIMPFHLSLHAKLTPMCMCIYYTYVLVYILCIVYTLYVREIHHPTYCL